MCIRRATSLALATLALGACASFQPLPGPVRDVVPQVGNREAIVTDRSGRDFRLTAVHLRGDSVVGLSIEEGRPVALAAADVREVRVLKGDPITNFFASSGVFLIIVGAAAALALIAHAASR
jgi:hypothetical protein